LSELDEPTDENDEDEDEDEAEAEADAIGSSRASSARQPAPISQLLELPSMGV